MSNGIYRCIKCGVPLEFDPYMVRDSSYFCPHCNKMIYIPHESLLVNINKEKARQRYNNKKKNKRNRHV